MKYGLKMWSRNENVLDKGVELLDEGIFDYIEVMPLPDSSPDKFSEYDIDYLQHFTTENFGFNLADKHNSDTNKNLIDLNLNWADELNVSKIIIHPAFGDISYLLDQLKLLDDERFITENMPVEGIYGEKMIGATHADLEKILNVLDSFCLDVCHAFKAAKSLKKDFKSYFVDLLSLNPTVFHISDSALDVLYDKHLKLGEGAVPLKFVRDEIKKNYKSSFVTIETPRNDLNSFEEDVENLQYFLDL